MCYSFGMMLTLFILAILATPFLARDFYKGGFHARSHEALEVQLMSHPEDCEAAIKLYDRRISRYPYYWCGLLVLLGILAF